MDYTQWLQIFFEQEASAPAVNHDIAVGGDDQQWAFPVEGLGPYQSAYITFPASQTEVPQDQSVTAAGTGSPVTLQCLTSLPPGTAEFQFDPMNTGSPGFDEYQFVAEDGNQFWIYWITLVQALSSGNSWTLQIGIYPTSDCPPLHVGLFVGGDFWGHLTAPGDTTIAGLPPDWLGIVISADPPELGTNINVKVGYTATLSDAPAKPRRVAPWSRKQK